MYFFDTGFQNSSKFCLKDELKLSVCICSQVAIAVHDFRWRFVVLCGFPPPHRFILFHYPGLPVTKSILTRFLNINLTSIQKKMQNMFIFSIAITKKISSMRRLWVHIWETMNRHIYIHKCLHVWHTNIWSTQAKIGQIMSLKVLFTMRERIFSTRSICWRNICQYKYDSWQGIYSFCKVLRNVEFDYLLLLVFNNW